MNRPNAVCRAGEAGPQPGAAFNGLSCHPSLVKAQFDFDGSRPCAEVYTGLVLQKAQMRFQLTVKPICIGCSRDILGGQHVVLEVKQSKPGIAEPIGRVVIRSNHDFQVPFFSVSHPL